MAALFIQHLVSVRLKRWKIGEGIPGSFTWGEGAWPEVHDLTSQGVPPLPRGCLSTRRRRVPCGRSSECTGHCPSVHDLPSSSPRWPLASAPAGPATCCPLRLGSSSESTTWHFMFVRICHSLSLNISYHVHVLS